MSSDIRFSCLYQGWIRHRRFKPVQHSFVYPIFMAYLDLDEINRFVEERWYCSLERFNFVSFRRKDYFQSVEPQTSAATPQDGAAALKADVIAGVEADARKQGVTLPEISRVCMLTHLRVLNLQFNPVSFYYCFDRDDQLVTIVSEITNTPWDERHSYYLYPGQNSAAMRYQQKGKRHHRFEFQKDFHVSPFNPMNMDYNWVFSEPDHACRVHMDNLLQDDIGDNSESSERKHFDATLCMQRKSLGTFGRTLIRYPFMCVSVVSGIYWHAFKLWIKRAPFYDHPKLQSEQV